MVSINQPYKALARHFHHLLNGFSWQPIMDPNDDYGIRTFVLKLVNERLPELKTALELPEFQ